MVTSDITLLTAICTTFVLLLRILNLPKRTWNGDDLREPSGCLTTTISMHPLRVAYEISQLAYGVDVEGVLDAVEEFLH